MNNKDDCSEEIKYIGLRIAYFRKLQNMTQAELAKVVHINKNYLSHIESGSTSKVISLPLLIKISKALNVELSILVDLSDVNDFKKELRTNFNEIKQMFNEIKEFNTELDKMIEEMDNL